MLFYPVLSFLPLVFLFHSHPCEAQENQKTVSYVNQKDACAEYQKCIKRLENKKDRNLVEGTGLKFLEFNPEETKFPLGPYTCSYKSNCRRAQRALCKGQMTDKGNQEIQKICKLTWLRGNDKEDETDPITSSAIEKNQTIACPNFKECKSLPDAELGITDDLLSPEESVNHKHYTCSYRTNCLKAKISFCDKVRYSPGQDAKAATALCAATWYLDERDQEIIGSRSLSGSKLQDVISELCNIKNNICKLTGLF